jgi:SAM-dependent methyltransferase
VVNATLEKVDEARPKPGKVTFSFGKNWQRFLDGCLTPQRERTARNSITDFLELNDLKGRSFLDIGCGSGLFSLAAYHLGARQIISVDVDPFSVRCCQELKRRAGDPESWEVTEGSILDDALVARIARADVVYAWGSLHHTGSMWKAIRNASSLVERGGLLYIAIYNRVDGRRGSEFWLRVKRLYNRSSWAGKRLLEALYFLRYGIGSNLVSLRNPRRFLERYSQGRGMNYWIDIRDWLGGYPYEFATVGEIFRFCTRELGMELVNLRSTNTLGTSDFLFRKQE